MHMSSYDPLGLRPNDPLEKWRDFHEKREKERAQARREREQEAQRAANAIAADEATQALEARVAALEEGNTNLEQNLVDVCRAVRGAIDNLADQREDLSREELRELKIEVAKLGSTMA